MAKRNTPPYGQAQYSTHEIAQQKTDGRGTWRGGARARDLTKAEHVALARKAARARWAQEKVKSARAQRSTRTGGSK